MLQVNFFFIIFIITNIKLVIIKTFTDRLKRYLGRHQKYY